MIRQRASHKQLKSQSKKDRRKSGEESDESTWFGTFGRFCCVVGALFIVCGLWKMMFASDNTTHAHYAHRLPRGTDRFSGVSKSISEGQIKAGIREQQQQASTVSVASEMDEETRLRQMAERLRLSDTECEWRTDVLLGACFGLKKVDESAYPNAFKDGESCMKHCCQMGDSCITFQFHPKKGCMVGLNVRLGLEHARTPNWCEPVKPQSWTGFKLINRDESNGDCEWDSANELITQCFGFGPEIKGLDPGPEACRNECCRDREKCTMWQYRGDKGCFTGKSHTCDVDNSAYFGMRKVFVDQ